MLIFENGLLLLTLGSVTKLSVIQSSGKWRWHNRLGHLHVEVIKCIISCQNLACTSESLHKVCATYPLSKSRRHSLLNMYDSFPNFVE